jgi:CHAT domain-containing protein
MLVYLAGSEESWLWVVRPSGLALHRLTIRAEALSAEVRALRSRLDLTKNHDGISFDVSRSYALYQKILGPAASESSGVRHLIVVSDGALQSLPLGVLVTEPPAGDAGSLDYRKVAWLARKTAVSVSPTVSSLRALRAVARVTGATRPLLGVSDPVLEGPLDAPVVVASRCPGRCRRGSAPPAVARQR